MWIYLSLTTRVPGALSYPRVFKLFQGCVPVGWSVNEYVMGVWLEGRARQQRQGNTVYKIFHDSTYAVCCVSRHCLKLYGSIDMSLSVTFSFVYLITECSLCPTTSEHALCHTLSYHSHKPSSLVGKYFIRSV